MSWFGIGIIKDWEEENKRLQEMVTNLLDQYELLEKKAISLEQEVIRLKAKRKRKKPQLSHKTGYTRISKDESIEMYEMYKSGHLVDSIAQYLNRSHSAVSLHIRKHLKEENDGRQQMENLPGREVQGIKEEE